MPKNKSVFQIEHQSMDEFTHIWSLILELMCSRNKCVAEIDAYPDEEWTSFKDLPSEVQAAQKALKAWACRPELGRPKKNPRMAINPDMGNEDLREAVRIFGPFSISARISDEHEDIVLENQDGGSGLIRLSESGKHKLAKALAQSEFGFEKVFTPLRPREHSFPWLRHWRG